MPEDTPTASVTFDLALHGLDLGAEDEVLGLDDALNGGGDIGADSRMLRLEIEKRHMEAHSALSSA